MSRGCKARSASSRTLRRAALSDRAQERCRTLLPCRGLRSRRTLLRGTTVSLLLAEWLGQAAEIAELERAFHAHEISNRLVAMLPLDGSRKEQGRGLASADERPLIDGMPDVRALDAAGVSLLLGTITWSFAAEMLRDRYGFARSADRDAGEQRGPVRHSQPLLR